MLQCCLVAVIITGHSSRHGDNVKNLVIFYCNIVGVIFHGDIYRFVYLQMFKGHIVQKCQEYSELYKGYKCIKFKIIFVVKILVPKSVWLGEQQPLEGFG